MIATKVNPAGRTPTSGFKRNAAWNRLAFVLTLAAAFLFAASASFAQEKPTGGEPPKAKKKKADDAKDKKADKKKDRKKKKEAGERGAKSDEKGEVEDLGGTPVAKVAEPKFDFGTIWAGPELRHAFQIKNEGDGVLKILNVKPS